MRQPTLVRWVLVVMLFTVTSAALLTLLISGYDIASQFRNPISAFVDPGVTIWWFVLGGPFRAMPDALGGIAFAAITNAAFWTLLLLLLVSIFRKMRHFFSTPSR